VIFGSAQARWSVTLAVERIREEDQPAEVRSVAAMLALCLERLAAADYVMPRPRS